LPNLTTSLVSFLFIKKETGFPASQSRLFMNIITVNDTMAIITINKLILAIPNIITPPMFFIYHNHDSLKENTHHSITMTGVSKKGGSV